MLCRVKRLKAIKVRIYPNAEQRVRLAQHFGAWPVGLQLLP